MPLLYEQAAEHIQHLIRSGERQPGDRLPTELELAQELGVSRITVKRAMSSLERQGLVERFRGKGTFVTRDASRLLAQRVSPTSDIDTKPADTTEAPRRKRIGFMIPEISDLFGVQTVNGIDDRCRELDIDLSLRRTHGDVELEAETIRQWIASGLDGIIVFPCHGEFYNEALLRTVLNKFPVVLVDRTLNGIPVPSVMTDNYAAARDITIWLLDQGHNSLAFASPPIHGTSSLEDRLRGFTEALQSHENASIMHLSCLQLESVLPGHNTTEAWTRDREHIARFLHERPDVTAFLASEYSIAVLIDSVITESKELQERDITIACFDSFPPSMTLQRYPHVAQDEISMGRLAVDLIIAQQEGQTPHGRHYVDFTLNTRIAQ